MNRRTLSRLLLVALLIGGIVLVTLNREHLNQAAVEAWLARLGLWGHLVFVLIWLVWPALFLPGAPLTLAGGALFGPLLGTVYTSIGSVSGATLAFLLARYLAGDWVARRTGGTLARVKAGVEEEGWRFVAFTRLVPLFPFNVLNYAFGVTAVPLRTFVFTSWLCMLPGTAGYAYIGYAAREAVVGGEDLVRKGLIAISVFAALALLPIMIRRLRKQAPEADANPPD